MQHLLDVLHELLEPVPEILPEEEPEPGADWLLLFALTLDEQRIAEAGNRGFRADQ